MYILGLYKVAFEDILETAINAKYPIQAAGMGNLVHGPKSSVNNSKETEISVMMQLKNMMSRDHIV